MISDLFNELTEMIGYDDAVHFVEMWEEMEEEQYAEAMTAMWQGT